MAPESKRRRLTANTSKQSTDSSDSWDDWVPQERIRKLTEEHKELATNLKKDMDAQRRAASGKPPLTSTKKRPFGSDLTGSSARGSEDRSSAAPQPPRGTKRGREIEGIDKVCHSSSILCPFKGVLAGPRPLIHGDYLHAEASRRAVTSRTYLCDGAPTPVTVIDGQSRGAPAWTWQFASHTLRSGVPRRPCLNFLPADLHNDPHTHIQLAINTDNMNRKRNSYDDQQSDSSSPTLSSLSWWTTGKRSPRSRSSYPCQPPRPSANF